MTPEEKKRLKEGKKAAEKRAKAIRAEEKKREKQERKEAKRREKMERKLAKKNKGAVVEEQLEEEETPEIVETQQENEPVLSENEQEAPVESRKTPTKRNYHVSLREDGKWQVKFAKGSRALKLFDTQAEAIAFAKKKAENQDGNITIHKKDGKIRKQNYAKKD